MARHAGTSPATVGRIWRDNDIKPHLTRTFKLSRDPRLEEKFWDIVGLYLNPPDKTLVLCCDEKTQCQALERTQPGLPLGVGHIRTKTHEDARLHTPWDDDAVRCAQLLGRQNPRDDGGPPSFSADC